LAESNNSKHLDRALESVDESRRSFMRKVVVTTAFTAPVVASFAIDGMMVSQASAITNLSNFS
jgi:hypothetical protein